MLIPKWWKPLIASAEPSAIAEQHHRERIDEVEEARDHEVDPAAEVARRAARGRPRRRRRWPPSRCRPRARCGRRRAAARRRRGRGRRRRGRTGRRRRTTSGRSGSSEPQLALDVHGSGLLVDVAALRDDRDLLGPLTLTVSSTWFVFGPGVRDVDARRPARAAQAATMSTKSEERRRTQRSCGAAGARRDTTGCGPRIVRARAAVSIENSRSVGTP